MANAAYTDTVQKVYIAYYGRAADPVGLGYWEDQLAANNGDLASIMSSFGTSAEATTLFGNLTNTTKVNTLYNQMFGRDADFDGLMYYAGQLTAGTMTAASIAQNILDGASGTDATIITNKLAVAKSFTAAIDTASEVVAYAGDTAATSARTLLATVTDTTVTASFDVATSVASIVSTANATPAAEGATYALTTAVDDFTGNSGNDTFSAYATTYTGLDSIDGGDGTDTLNLASTTAIADVSGVTVANIETINLRSVTTTDFDTSTGFTGLTTLNSTLGTTVLLEAAATTDVNVFNSVNTATVTGGKDVTITHTTLGDVTATATAGALDITTAFGAVVVGGGASTTNALGTVTVDMTGTAAAKTGVIGITGGTVIDVTASGAISLADRTAHAATKAADILVAAADGSAGTAKVADTTAGTLVTDLASMATGLAADTTIVGNNAETLNSMKAGDITQAQKVAIDAAYSAAFNAVDGTAALAQAATLAVYTPIQTAATAAKVVTADALTAAAATSTASTAVVTADALVNDAVDNIKVTAIQNTALTSASVTGNFGAAGNAITDASTASNTLTTATLDNAGVTTLTGAALATVNLANQVSNVVVVNATADNALTLNLDTVTAGIDVSTGAGDSVTLNAAVTGTNSFTLTAADTTALNISGAGDLTLGTALPQAAAVIDASTATGNLEMLVSEGQTFTGGAGNDTVTINNGALQAKAVAGGLGTDTLILGNIADFASTGAAKFAGFETLQSNAIAVDVSKFTASTIGEVKTNGSSSFTALSATQAANVTAMANGTITLGVTGSAVVGQLDVVSIDVNDAAAAVNTITLTAPVIAGVETLNLTATDNVVVTALTSATALTNVNVTGAGTVGITSGAVVLNVNTVVDASAVDSVVTLDFVAGTANGVSLKAGDGNNFLTGTDVASKGNSIVSGDGNSSLTGGQADDIITAGSGNNIVVTGNGVNTVTAGDGHNTITGGTGVDTVTVGNGYNTINTGTGADVIVAGTGGNDVDAGTGADTVTFGVNVAGVSNAIASDDGDSGAYDLSATTLVSSTTLQDVYTGLSAGDTIDLGGSLLSEANYDGFTTATAGAALTNVVTVTTIGQFIGTYDAVAATFTSDATGDDLMLSYDGGDTTTADESIILVGMTNVLADTEMTNGLITIA